MSDFILPVGPQPIRPEAPRIAGAGETPAKSFKDLLTESIDKVNALQKEADSAQAALAAGKTDNVAEVFTAVRKAELAFEALMQIRNKLVDAYEEIQRMRI
ncbi:MAG: flagellar hook-basal body complex protein FliE [Candidatus Brocadiae bacterium]|nr:flagellar hook-basal body complex protein FliE [Candidatus Brocadiia bacterium]